ncbi:ABC transporter permease [Alteromonas stellipolaris]|jgi:putative ABC transport system permease protein|uniref:ABC transporter permease n=1 Tax=Alteromonas TaxID=226 RepID=UPI0007702D6D|nr:MULTISPECIES: FtsX-like permease family protein [Alteromonas]AMJ90633.1 cell division protein FtsX [Alteromonas sp. Mac2]AMJ86773.1 cell division protein FtsX [Alteromonas sp. Mac1]AMJ94517.1 cell division protein FtsX [Alteromonas stellipolaris]ANB23174.1 cell division protein FtsX [Alteromonas stellipolaris]MDO6535801.1 ABC transporter permease [Alteromonas stellipolaris]
MLDIKPIFNAIRRSKIGAVLLLLQIALTMAIVSNAAFMINDHVSYLREDTGFPEKEIFSLSVMTFGKDRSLSQQAELDETMIRSLPGVIDASLIQAIPLSGGGSSSSVRLKPSPEKSKSISVPYYYMDEHGLNTFGIKLLEGRNFRPEEVIVGNDFSGNGPNTIIVSQALADALFSDGGALGETVYLKNRPLEIIGIVGTMKSPWPNGMRDKNTAIVPFMDVQNYQHILVRTDKTERANIMANIEQNMLDVYDKRVIINVDGLDKTKENYDATDVLMMRMLIVLVVILLLVTALGIFGLTQFNISKRTKQIGTRRALGARKSAIVRYFLVENTMVCIAGLLIGGIAAVVLGDVMMKSYSISSLEPEFILGTAVFIFVMSIVAVIFPAMRAANISPSIATRSI